MTSEPDAVDGLYELPPEDFVEARNRLAAELRKGGDKEQAALVKDLRRPAKLAWALNQVARADPAAIDELLSTSADVRRGQEALLAGGDRDELRRAASRHREVLDRLGGQVAALVGAVLRPDAVAALEGAAADPELAVLLRAGRLTKEPDRPVGFQFGDMDIATPRTAKPRPAKPEPAKRDPRQRELELTRAKRDLERAERELATATQRAERAEARAAEAVAEADAARAAVGRVRDGRDRAAAALERQSSQR